MLAKILIVDDDPDMVALLQTSFTGAGYSVRTATSGTQALATARRSPPDLVLLDLVLPEVNGFTVCQALRREPATASVPIVLMTGLPGEFPRMAGMEVGADAYLRKPFDVEELILRVDELLQPAHGCPAALVTAQSSTGSRTLQMAPQARCA
jgi:two-component system response regulator RpaA